MNKEIREIRSVSRFVIGMMALSIAVSVFFYGCAEIGKYLDPQTKSGSMIVKVGMTVSEIVASELAKMIVITGRGSIEGQEKHVNTKPEKLKLRDENDNPIASFRSRNGVIFEVTPLVTK